MFFGNNASGTDGVSGRGLRTGLRHALSATPLVAMILASGHAAAQQTAQAPTVDEEIVVTGTRVVRDGYEAPTPVSVIGVEQLSTLATSNLADAINQLPALARSASPQSSAGQLSSGQGAINGLNLRGLGTSRTLVLLNGQRTVGSNLVGAVDVSELPQHLIERVDVVTGGASAVYGSDALAGVVNFVLDTDFTGLKGEVSGGITTYGDAPNYKVNAAFGTRFAGGRAHFMISAEHSFDDGLLINNRPWMYEGHGFVNNPAYGTGAGQTTNVPALLKTTHVGLSTVSSPGGIISQGPLKGTVFGPGGTYSQLVLGDIVSGQVMRGGSWLSQLASPLRGTAIQPRQTRQDVFTRVSYDLNDDTHIYVQGAWGHLDSFSSGAPNFYLNNLTLRSENAFLPEALRPTLTAAGSTFTFGTLNWDLDNFRPVLDRRVLRFVTGIDGTFDMGGSAWSWDAYLGTGESFGSSKAIGAIDTTRYMLALDSVRATNGQIVCRSTLTNPGNGCVPYNPFGIGVNSTAAVDYLQGRYGWNNHRLSQSVAAVNFAGEPFSSWAGPASLAFGYEFRKEAMRQISDPEEQANPTIWFQNAGQPYTGQFSVHDVYAETVVPLAKDAPWAKALDLNGAVRGTHYSVYGWVATWKVGATYAATDDLRFRVTQSRNIRSPTMVDLYLAGVNSQQSIRDPFNNNAPITRVRTIRGNPNLGPEKSSDTGIGVVYQPSWLEGFSASVDYYRIRIKDAVNQLDDQQLVDLCFVGYQPACSTFTREGTGPTALLRVTVQPQNFATEMTRGIDFETSYALPLSVVSESWDGNMRLRLLATHFIDYQVNSGIPNDPTAEYAGVSGAGGGLGTGSGGLPSWRVNGTMDYALDPVRVGFGFRYIPRGLAAHNRIECTTGCPVSTAQFQTVDDNRIDAAFYLDFNAAYTLHFGETAETEMFFNVRNITNKDPSIVAPLPTGSGWIGVPTASGTFDTLGRVFRAGVRFKM